MNERERAEMADSKRLVSKPGAVIEVYSYKLPERIQRAISEAIARGRERRI